MGRTCSVHVLSMFCACSFHGNSMNNMLSYCGLIAAKIRAFDKDLPALQEISMVGHDGKSSSSSYSITLCLIEKPVNLSSAGRCILVKSADGISFSCVSFIQKGATLRKTKNIKKI